MSYIIIRKETVKMIKHLALLLFFLVNEQFYLVSSEPTYYSYEASTNLIDDGRNVVTKLEESNFDSSKSLGPVVKQRIYVSPSRRVGSSSSSSSSSESLNKIITKNQILSNEIGSGLFSSYEVPVKSYRNSRGYRRGYLTSARTVESPAISVDSGGQASTSLAKELAKVFNVKQGFYSGTYENMENRLNKPTRRTPEIIEENARELVQEIFQDQSRYPNRHLNHNFNKAL